MLRAATSDAFHTGLCASCCTEKPAPPGSRVRTPSSALVTLLARLQLIRRVAAATSCAAEYCSATSWPCESAGRGSLCQQAYQARRGGHVLRRRVLLRDQLALQGRRSPIHIGIQHCKRQESNTTGCCA